MTPAYFLSETGARVVGTGATGGAFGQLKLEMPDGMVFMAETLDEAIELALWRAATDRWNPRKATPTGRAIYSGEWNDVQ